MTRIASDEEWRAARLELLAEEKALQAARDALAAKRRKLPLRRIRGDYAFDSEEGRRSLAELFGDCSQLIVYHFMFPPEWEQGCKSCSFWADSYNGTVEHLRARDVSLVAVSRAPLATLLAYRNRLGWSFPWVSSVGDDFNRDFGVTFTQECIDAGNAEYNYRRTSDVIGEMPGLSVFKKDGDGEVLHFYSTYSRGLDPLNAAYQLLDLTPEGRNEGELAYSMEWLRRRDEYET